ncbi:MAG: response regulator [Proteobacteria bacterium]|nr:response regulator [Pseudomonadota bacterium]
MIRILLVDDHELVRAGFKALLNAVEDMVVVGVAQSGEEAIGAVVKLSLDVVLMDISMPGIGGVEACRRILKQDSAVKIIAISAQNDGPIPQQLLKIGVMSFVSKGSSLEEMVLAIRKVMVGKRYLCTEVANSVALQGLACGESPFAKLSQRESEVVTLILQGKTIQEMAHMLVLSDKTVNTYRYRLYDKLHVKNDVELTRLATKFGHMMPD